MSNFHRNSKSGDAVVLKETITFSSLKDDFANLLKNHESFVEYQVIGQSEQGQDIQALRVGTCDSVPILICGCHWGREWISVEIPYLFAEFLVTNYQKDDRVTRIVDGTQIWFIPMVNPDGHERTVTQQRWWTRNSPKPERQSVILNRNYDTSAWKSLKTKYFSPDPKSEYYRGPSAAYALEVQAMQNLIGRIPFKGVLNYHSNGRFVVFPTADKAVQPQDSKPRELAATVTAKINEKFTVKKMAGKITGNPYESLQDNQLYAKMEKLKRPELGFYGGSLTDFVSEKLPDCIAIGVLLEPDRGDRRAFRLPASEIDNTFELHLAAMLTFLNCVTTARKQPTPKPMQLNKPGIPSMLVAYQTDCSVAFPADQYPKVLNA